jgi:poly(glycerol-phosphate) alpha-glucosyltransferase
MPPPWTGLVAEEKKILLYLGRIHPKKGLNNLLEAWHRCGADNSVQKFSNWTLVIAGWDQGGHEAELQSLANDLGISQDVVFVGPQFDEAKQACYHHADAFVLPSYSEGLPMVVLEAWAYSLPVIMTPQCNLPEGFKAGAAISVAADASEIARGLRTLIEMHDGDHQAMGERGFNLVRERFTWMKIASEMTSVYKWILGGGIPSACVRLD